MNHKMPKVSIALNAFGALAAVSSLLFLLGSFVVSNELGKAFCLGAFFSGLIGTILLFGFSKVIDLLDQIREQTQIAGSTGEGPVEERSGG